MATSNYVANFNLTSWANAQAQLNSGNPQDVTIPIMNENGDITNVTVPNRGMFQKRVWDDVGGALGQFNRKFYVDQKNGDDDNDGSSSRPFKSLDKAFSSIPIGGSGSIVILGKYVNKSWAIGTPRNSYIELSLDTNAYIEFETLYDSDSDRAVIPTILLNNCALTIYISTNTDVPDEAKVKFKQTDPNGYLDKDLRPDFAGFFAYPSRNGGVSSLSMYTRIHDNEVIVFELKKGYLFYRKNWDGDFNSFPIMNVGVTHYTGTLARFTSDDARIMDIYKTAIINLSGEIVDADGNGISYSDRINGIRRDSDSGNPINILSVQNFSS